MEKPSSPASHKMMDYLANRTHSEKELRTKLQKHYTPEEIENAIEYGKTKGWIASTDEALNDLSQETAAALSRKGKGADYINQFLQEKGLPQIKADSSSELEKARQLVENKFDPLDNPSREEREKRKAKIGRFLMARGFDMETIEKIVDGDRDEN